MFNEQYVRMFSFEQKDGFKVKVKKNQNFL